MIHKLLCTFAAASAIASVTPANAQQWPDKSMRLFVAQGAGGGQDTIARYLADKVSQELKQQIIIENRPGAGALIGMQAAFCG